ncbi:hypothetical protein THAOC_12614, partial [Thalassiosira oceanica]
QGGDGDLRGGEAQSLLKQGRRAKGGKGLGVGLLYQATALTDCQLQAGWVTDSHNQAGRHASARISGGNLATTHDSNDAEEEILFLCGSSYSDATLCALATECPLGDQAECPAGYYCYAIPASTCVASPTSSPLQKSGDFLQIGDWRLARACETCDRSIFSISSQAHGKTSQILRDDGTYHAGPRTDFNGFDLGGGDGLTYSSQPIVFGDKAVQIRDWRIRQVHPKLLSVTNENGNVSRIYRSDGTVHGNVKEWSGYINEDLGEPACAYLTSSFLQLGDWRFGEMGGHLVVTHKDGQTGETSIWCCLHLLVSASNADLFMSSAMIYRHDGTMHPGPRTDHDAWTLVDDDVLAGSKEGCPRGDFLQIGDWRLARTCETCGDSHFSISSQAHGKTSQIFRDDGTWHPGPRADYNGFDLTARGSGLTRSTQPIVFGHMAVQIRDWRIRQVDSNHLSVTNENGNVSRIYRSDGTVYGNSRGFGGYIIEDLGEPTCAYLTSSFLQLGDWRFGEIGGHLSVTHKSGQTGPRTDHNAWALVDDEVIAGTKEGCDESGKITQTGETSASSLADLLVGNSSGGRPPVVLNHAGMMDQYVPKELLAKHAVTRPAIGIAKVLLHADLNHAGPRDKYVLRELLAMHAVTRQAIGIARVLLHVVLSHAGQKERIAGTVAAAVTAANGPGASKHL